MYLVIDQCHENYDLDPFGLVRYATALISSALRDYE